MPSVGAVENVARLRDPKSGVSVGIIPSGITNAQQSPDLVSLGTLFYEPLWLFHRASEGLKRHEDLSGRTISIGPEGSGTHALAVEFLARVGIVDEHNAKLLPLAPDVATEKLLHGEIDGVALLAAWESPVVRQLVSAQDIVLASVPRADAFVALYPYLSKVVLPAGVGDMAKNRPPTDVVLVASQASLVVREDLHPAIQYLLLEAAREIHSAPGMFRRAGQFPAAESIDLPLSTHAQQFYKTGAPFLQRHLPFGLAVLAQQGLVLLIPVLGVVYPLLKFCARPLRLGYAAPSVQTLRRAEVSRRRVGRSQSARGCDRSSCTIGSTGRSGQPLSSSGVFQAVVVCIAVAHQPGTRPTAETVRP